MFDLQKVFDTAIKGILAQGKLAKSGFVTCFYRHPDNPAVRCAIGHNIPDDQYSPKMEKITPYLGVHGTKWAKAIAAACGATTENDGFILRELQRCHDTVGTLDGFRAEAREFAAKYKLNTGVLDNA